MTRRRISCHEVLSVGIVLLAFGQVCAAWTQKHMQAEAERIVSKYKAVFDAPPKRVPSRDSVGGALLGNGDLGAVISGAPEAQRFWISKNSFWRLRDGHRQGGPRLFGGLEVNIPALAGGKYRLEQQLFGARTTARFAKGAITVRMRSWVAAADDFLLVELSVAGSPVEVATKLWAAPGRGSTEELGRRDSVLWATKAFFTQADWKTQVTPTKAACAMTVIGAKEPTFTLQPGRTVTIAVAMRSSFDSKEPLPAAQKMAQGLNADGVSALRAKHLQWWRGFWAKSLVEIGDPILEQRYYLSNYVMGSASRNVDFPPGLFGLWVTHDDPRWAGDYHLNYNFQAPFYALYSGNHIEQADPYDGPILAFMARGRAYAKKVLKIRGVYYPVGIGPKGIETSLRGGGCFLGQKSNAAYCLVNVAMHWYSTYDTHYAKRVYPFVLEVANFWEDYLKFEGGRYVIHNDSVHENSGADYNSIVSLGLVRNTFELAVDMSGSLGVDAGRDKKWRHILKNLSGFATQERDGVTVFRYTEKGMAWHGGNTLGIQHIYPAGAIGLDSDPKLLEVSRNTIRVMNRWTDGNGMSSIYASAVRVGYDGETILRKLREMIAKVGGKNGFTRGNVHGVENCSIVPNAVNEMLCMGHQGVLRVFPVWPKGKDARFMNIRAWGAFLVSSELTDGKVRYVKIHSEKGRDCTLVNPWPKRPVDVYRGGKKTATLRGERILMKTKAAATVVLCPAGGGCPITE